MHPQSLVCLVSLFVSVCRSCVSSSSVCPASTHTALVSSPSLAVLHLPTYIHTGIGRSRRPGGNMGTASTTPFSPARRQLGRLGSRRQGPLGSTRDYHRAGGWGNAQRGRLSLGQLGCTLPLGALRGNAVIGKLSVYGVSLSRIGKRGLARVPHGLSHTNPARVSTG